MKRKNSSGNVKENVIMSREKQILDFTVTYELTETQTDNEKTYCIRLSKKSKSKEQHFPEKSKILEESVLQNFESKKETAISIYNAVVENKVTPMCLYDSVLELI